MINRTPRHSAMVDFLQHQQRLYVVLEEDHEKALAAATPKWKPVSDGLPDPGEVVLCYCEGAKLTGIAWQHRLGGWAMPEPQGIGYETITHWMPLPEPPAKEVKP